MRGSDKPPRLGLPFSYVSLVSIAHTDILRYRAKVSRSVSARSLAFVARVARSPSSPRPLEDLPRRRSFAPSPRARARSMHVRSHRATTPRTAPRLRGTAPRSSAGTDRERSFRAKMRAQDFVLRRDRSRRRHFTRARRALGASARADTRRGEVLRRSVAEDASWKARGVAL